MNAIHGTGFMAQYAECFVEGWDIFGIINGSSPNTYDQGKFAAVSCWQ